METWGLIRAWLRKINNEMPKVAQVIMCIGIIITIKYIVIVGF